MCVFYLVLRALDTVEDDMAVPVAVKVPLLRAFHKHCGDTGHVVDCGYGPYVDLMKRYAHVATVFNGLERGYGAVIADITQRMGNGMADFIEKEVETVADYDLYCHYVAGLVGIGLSDVSEREREGGEGRFDLSFFPACPRPALPGPPPAPATTPIMQQARPADDRPPPPPPPLTF